MPNAEIFAIAFPSGIKLFNLKSNPNSSFLLYKYANAKIKLKDCPITVAQAAPATSILNPATNTISNTMLIIAAIATNINGLLESPIPRIMAETTLYP